MELTEYHEWKASRKITWKYKREGVFLTKSEIWFKEPIITWLYPSLSLFFFSETNSKPSQSVAEKD